MWVDAVEDKVITVTLIPTMELSSQQRSVWFSQAGVNNVGMFRSTQQLCLFHVGYVLFCGCGSLFHVEKYVDGIHIWKCLTCAKIIKKKNRCTDCLQHHTGDTTEVQKKLKNSQTSSAIYIKYSCVLKKPKLNFELSC